jgi:hypothetical protein
MKKICLHKFIEEIGDEKAGEIFGVKPRAAQTYRLGDRDPKIKNVPAMIKASGGRLNFESFFCEEC